MVATAINALSLPRIPPCSLEKAARVVLPRVKSIGARD